MLEIYFRFQLLCTVRGRLMIPRRTDIFTQINTPHRQLEG